MIFPVKKFEEIIHDGVRKKIIKFKQVIPSMIPIFSL